MNRLQHTLDALKQAGKTALIPYITAGDPNPDVTVDFMHALVEAGADIIELGVPFSDPMADGPTIQLACERALVHNTSLRDVLGMVQAFRSTNSQTPVVLMGYLNPVEMMGYDTFAEQAIAHGVDGVLLVDLPPEESEDVAKLFTQHGLDTVYLIAPTTSDERIAHIGRVGSGYVYYVSLKGVTGSSDLDVNDVAANIERIKRYVNLPVGVGFGIKDGATASAVGKLAEGVIVGSALVNQIAAHAEQPDQARAKLKEVLVDMRTALDAS